MITIDFSREKMEISNSGYQPSEETKGHVDFLRNIVDPSEKLEILLQKERYNVLKEMLL